jgi:RNA polymerase sigma-70 factor (ECF subfamily)
MNDHVAGKAADLLLERQFAALRPELLRLPLWLARDRSIAEDAVQETLLRAWKARGSLDDPSLGAAEDPRIGELRAAILLLPDDHRAPLVMQVLGGVTTAQIAAELNLSQPAVLTRLFRARDKLRELYGLAPRGAGAAEEPGP